MLWIVSIYSEGKLLLEYGWVENTSSAAESEQVVAVSASFPMPCHPFPWQEAAAGQEHPHLSKACPWMLCPSLGSKWNSRGLTVCRQLCGFVLLEKSHSACCGTEAWWPPSEISCCAGKGETDWVTLGCVNDSLGSTRGDLKRLLKCRRHIFPIFPGWCNR